MRPCQPPAVGHIVSSTSPWALPPPEFHKQDPRKGSSPYFWRMAEVLSRALGRKWRTVRVWLLKAPSPPDSGDQGPLNSSIILCSVHQTLDESFWILKKPANTSKLSSTPPTTSPNLPAPLRARQEWPPFFVCISQPPSNPIPVPQQRDSPTRTNDAKLSRHRQVNHSWA